MNHRAKRISRRATGTKKSGAKKIYPRVMEMTRGTAFGGGGEENLSGRGEKRKISSSFLRSRISFARLIPDSGFNIVQPV